MGQSPPDALTKLGDCQAVWLKPCNFRARKRKRVIERERERVRGLVEAILSKIEGERNGGRGIFRINAEKRMRGSKCEIEREGQEEKERKKERKKEREGE